MFKILVVEDDRELNRTVCAYLRGSGYTAVGCLDAGARTAVYNGAEIPLTVREFNLIYKLLSYPKKTFTRSQLMDEFWDSASAAGPRTVDVYIT